MKRKQREDRKMNGYWRAVFWAAAAFNMLAGLPSLLAPEAAGAAAGLPPLDPQFVIVAQTSGLLICSFGLGYAMVAMGQSGARQIILLGLIGKLGVCILVALRMRETAVPPMMAWASVGDFIFIIVFAAFLVAGPKPSSRD
jgi:hypothetical protein